MNASTYARLRRGAEMVCDGPIPPERLGVYHVLFEGQCPFCDSDVHRTDELDFDPYLLGWERPGDGGWTTEPCLFCSFPTRLWFSESIKYI